MDEFDTLIDSMSDEEVNALLAEIEAEDNAMAASSSYLNYSPMTAPFAQPEVYQHLPDLSAIGEKMVGAPGRIVEGFQSLYNLPETLRNATGTELVNMGGRTAAMVAPALAFPPAAPITAPLGGFVYDQANQLLGNTKDTPLKEDLERLIGGDIFDSAVSYGTARATAPVTGAIGKGFSNLYDRDKALLGSISQNPADYAQGVRGQVPLNEAVGRLKGGGMFNDLFTDQSLATSKAPFADLYGEVAGQKQLYGQSIDDTLMSSPATVAAGEINPRAALNTSSATSGAITKTRDAISDIEFDNLAKRTLVDKYGAAQGESLFNEYKIAQGKLKSLDTKVGKGEFDIEAGNKPKKPAFFSQDKSPISAEEGRSLSLARQTVNEIEDDVLSSQVPVADVAGLKRAYDAEAGYNKGDAELSRRADAYSDLGNQARDKMYGAMNDPRFEAQNQTYSDLSAVETPLNARQGAEAFTQEPGMLSKTWDAVTSPVKSFFNDKPFSTGTPQTLLRQSLGQTLPQKFGGALQSGAQYADPYMTRAAPILGGMQGLNDIPDIAIQAAPGALTPALTPVPTAPQQQEFTIPRTIETLDTQGFSNLIPMYVAPNDLGPVMYQWKNIAASGDKKKMAQFLGKFSEKYPDFPFQRGAITGLPSEFDIGDGKTRLFSLTDIAAWEDEINRSPLRDDEKALRVKSLRENGLVIPFSQRANNLDKLQENGPADSDPAMTYMLQTHPFTPRERTTMGSRRVEQ